jgi:repressor LexA
MGSTAEERPPAQRKPRPREALSSRQRKILQAIRDSIEQRGYPPSLREIRDAVGLDSISAVSYQLSVLEAKGVLRRDPGLPRAIEILRPARASAQAPKDATVTVLPQDAVLVPLIGRIAAGPPILAEENFEDFIPLPRWLVPRTGELFLLRVVGDSMIGAAITDGDLVLVRDQQVAENGDIVAAMIDGEATVKKLSVASGHVWLLPHNQAYAPIPGDEAIILGKVVSVLRKVEQ